MKKALLSVCLICFTLFLWAQGEFRLGLTTTPTLNFAATDATGIENDGSKVGFQYGLMFDYDLTGEERYYLNSGLVLHHSGLKYQSSLGVLPTTINFNQSLTYIELPVGIKLRSNAIGGIAYYGQFGLNTGILVGDKIKEPETPTLEPDLTNINVALNIGGGIEYGLSDDLRGIVGVFYNNGFTDVFDEDVFDEKIKLNQLGLRLGVFF